MVKPIKSDGWENLGSCHALSPGILRCRKWTLNFNAVWCWTNKKYVDHFSVGIFGGPWGFEDWGSLRVRGCLLYFWNFMNLHRSFFRSMLIILHSPALLISRWPSGHTFSTTLPAVPRHFSRVAGDFWKKNTVYRYVYGGCLKWWYPQNTPKWSFWVGKPMVVGYHHFRKQPYSI